MNILEDPLSSALSFIEKFIIGARTLHVQNLTQYGLAVSLAYLSGEEGGNFPVQKMILPAFATRRGWGVGTL